MSANDMTGWRTGISQVVSSDDEEEVLIRGRKLSELTGTTGFAEMMFLLLSGQDPTPGQARVLDALLVASMEHGIAPPSMIARCFASYGTNIQAAMAGGIMAFGDVMGGAGEALAEMLADTASSLDIADPSDDALKAVAERLVREAHDRGQRIPGYGIPLHAMDPRAPKMLEIARAEDVFGTHCRLAMAIERAITDRRGKPVPMNLDGVSAAVILDLGFDWQATRLFLLVPRSVSMAAHYLEERSQGSRWRHIPESEITYESD